jgi:hypothetical protein
MRTLTNFSSALEQTPAGTVGLSVKRHMGNLQRYAIAPDALQAISRVLGWVQALNHFFLGPVAKYVVENAVGPAVLLVEDSPIVRDIRRQMEEANAANGAPE